MNLHWDDSHGNTLNIFLPRHHSNPGKRTSAHPRSSRNSETQKPDTLFAHRYLASAASVYFRPVVRYPRCILWRVLEDSHVLSLSSVDFTKPHDTRDEFATTFRFYFPDPINANCVGFTDAPDRDELVVYVMTAGKIIYTLNLTADFFRGSVTKKTTKDSDFCRTFSPSSFTLHSPHFLTPIDHESLLVSLQDGVLLKLEKSSALPEGMRPVPGFAVYADNQIEPEMSVSRYVEKTFSEGSYMSFMAGKLPWVRMGTVKHGRDSVSYSAVISSAVYIPRRAHGGSEGWHGGFDSLLFTVSVNHTLKTWSLDKGTLLHAVDLLNEAPAPSSRMKTLLDPSPSQLLTVIDASLQEDHMFYLASFSSASTGKFKFWAALRGANGEFEGLADLYPHDEFKTDPPTSNSVWMISEFRITPVQSQTSGLFNLWVLWKSNTTFRAQNLQFRMQDIPGSWGKWTTGIADSLHGLPGRSPSNATSEDVTDYWIDWIFFPGRFTDTVLVTALDIHRLFYSPPGSKPTEDVGESLQSRVARAIPGAVELHKTEDGSPDYARYKYEVDLQWLRYSRLCTELDKQRGEALSLVADPHSGFIWTVNADGITALRECTESEVMQHNSASSAENLELISLRLPRKLGAGLAGTELSDAMFLIQAASDLRSSLSEKAYDNCLWRLQRELLEDAVYSYEDRMWSLFSKCLDGEVSNDDFDKIEDSIDAMNDPQIAFYSILSSLFQAEGHAGAARLTSFGGNVLIAGSREVIHVNRDLLFGLIFLLLLITAQDDETPKISEPEKLYEQLLNYMREYEVLNWMARTPLSIPDSRLSIDDELTRGLASLKVTTPDPTSSPKTRKGSVLQLMLPENSAPPSHGHGNSGSIALSLCIRQYLAGLELANFGNGFAEVASVLLNIDAAGVAMELLKYIPTTSWGFYVKARIQLKDRNPEAASMAFKKAAYGLCMSSQ